MLSNEPDPMRWLVQCMSREEGVQVVELRLWQGDPHCANEELCKRRWHGAPRRHGRAAGRRTPCGGTRQWKMGRVQQALEPTAAAVHTLLEG